MVPLAYFLLPNKTKQTYCEMFELLKNYALTNGKVFSPQTFQLDFEVAALSAIEEKFPSAERKGCLFHYSQCLWRKVQQFGLVPYYDDRIVHKFVRSCSALALVPLSRLDDGWLEIQADSPAPDHPASAALERFKEYFISTWLENDAVYPRALWNHYGNFGPRTTNHLEGWHRYLNKRVGRTHVNIFDMVHELKHLETKYKNEMLMLRMGQRPPRQKRAYEALNQRLMGFVHDFETDRLPLINYIHNVAYNLKFGDETT